MSAENNTSHAVEPNKSSGTSPPALSSSPSARTGIPVLDNCVRDYRLATILLDQLRTGVLKVTPSMESLFQVRALLHARAADAAVRDNVTEALKASGFPLEQLEWAHGVSLMRHRAIRAYVKGGEHCYEVSPALADRLQATELRGVTGEMLRLPFDSIAIVVPEGMNDFAQVVFLDVRPAGTMSTDPERPNPGPMLSMVACSDHGDRINTFALHTSLDAGDIADELAYCLQRVQWSSQFGRSDDYIGRPSSDVLDQLKRMFWWTLNVCLYIAHPGAEQELKHPNLEAEHRWNALSAELGPKRRRRLLDLYNSAFRRRIYLGRSVPSLGTGARGPIGVQTLVGGHWRNQPCGKNRFERRLIWIEPFWRGPRDAPISNPIRVMCDSNHAGGANRS